MYSSVHPILCDHNNQKVPILWSPGTAPRSGTPVPNRHHITGHLIYGLQNDAPLGRLHSVHVVPRIRHNIRLFYAQRAHNCRPREHRYDHYRRRIHHM